MIFSRKKLKESAKELLRVHYWNIFFATLLIAVPSLIYNLSTNFKIFVNLSVLFSILLSILVLPALEVGIIQYLLKIKEGQNPSISYVLKIFNSEQYVNVIKIMFLRNLYLFGWTMLFVIPGIIKSYEYRFVPYLLAENEDLCSQEVFALSRKYTENIKMDIYILDLSFMGLYILGFLFFFVGMIFVAPYQHVVNMELFHELSRRKSVIL